MPTKYTDAWLRQQFYEDKDRFTVETPPDPAHGDTSELPEAVNMKDAPILQGGGDIVFDGKWENREHIPPSQQIDTTPVDGQGTPAERGHGFGNVTRPYSNVEGYGRGVLGAARGRDQGASNRATSQHGRPYRLHHEQWFGITTEGYEPPPITEGPGDTVLRRGLNAYPENDGDGGRTRGDGTNSWNVNMPSWKRGRYQLSNINRDFTPPNRTHNNARMVRPDIVTIIGDAPPPTKPDKYHSPYSSLQRFLPTRRRISGLRRSPGPWDEAAIASAPPSIQIEPIDGMVVP